MIIGYHEYTNDAWIARVLPEDCDQRTCMIVIVIIFLPSVPYRPSVACEASGIVEVSRKQLRLYQTK